MEDNYTISETFVLPSKGSIYSTAVNQEVTLRSMKTKDEMRRLSPSEYIYKPLCEMIENCIVGEKPGIHVYDMCLGDYQFLLHKLRVVTYGSDYQMRVKCPNCGEITTATVDLNSETVLEWDDEILKLLDIELPRTKKRIHMKYMTPRMMDAIQLRKKEMLRKSQGDMLDPSISLTAQALIDTVDDEKLSVSKLESFVDNLPAMDLKYLLGKAEKLNERIGLDTTVVAKCGQCGYDVITSFRLEPEFFGPTID